jgi:hypothetical protein
MLASNILRDMFECGSNIRNVWSKEDLTCGGAPNYGDRSKCSK